MELQCSPEHPTLRATPCVHQPGSSPNPVCLGFCGGFIDHKHDCSPHSHWPLAIDSTSSPSPLPGGGAGGGTESSNPLITGQFPWHPAPSPRSLTYIHLINLTRDIFITLILKGFRSSLPETGTKTQSVFLIIHHSIIVGFPEKSKCEQRLEEKEGAEAIQAQWSSQGIDPCLLSKFKVRVSEMN